MSERVFARANQRCGPSLTGAFVDTDSPDATHEPSLHQ